MWLRNRLYFRFCSSISRQDHLMLFASYPVGYPMLTKIHENYKNLHVVTHYTKPTQNFTNEVERYCKINNIECHIPVIKEQSKAEK